MFKDLYREETTRKQVRRCTCVALGQRSAADCRDPAATAIESAARHRLATPIAAYFGALADVTRLVFIGSLASASANPCRRRYSDGEKPVARRKLREK